MKSLCDIDLRINRDKWEMVYAFEVLTFDLLIPISYGYWQLKIVSKESQLKLCNKGPYDTHLFKHQQGSSTVHVELQGQCDLDI